MEIEIKLGHVMVDGGTMLASLVIDADGSGRIRLFAIDTACRRQGVMMHLGPDEWTQLGELLAKVQAAIGKAQASGQCAEWPKLAE
jgi:hypothetical protein